MVSLLHSQLVQESKREQNVVQCDIMEFRFCVVKFVVHLQLSVVHIVVLHSMYHILYFSYYLQLIHLQFSAAIFIYRLSINHSINHSINYVDGYMNQPIYQRREQRILKNADIYYYRLVMYYCIYQGWRKLFITGQVKLNPNIIQSNVWEPDKFITADICNVISPTSLKTTLSLRLLLSFLHNGIPCKHNVWESNNLASLHMPLLPIIAQ